MNATTHRVLGAVVSIVVATTMLALLAADAQAYFGGWNGCGRSGEWQVWANSDRTTCPASRTSLRAARPHLQTLYAGKRFSTYVRQWDWHGACLVHYEVADFATRYVGRAWREVAIYQWKVNCRGRGQQRAVDQFVKRAGWRVI